MPLVVGDRERMYRLGHELRARGLFVAPVDYPAVPEDRICFRACVTANHSRADLDDLLRDKLSDALSEEQKMNKINNLITNMRHAGQIRNTGPRKTPCWVLIEPDAE